MRAHLTITVGELGNTPKDTLLSLDNSLISMDKICQSTRLEDLDGAQGLKALRVTVDMQAPPASMKPPVESLTDVVEIARG